MKSHEDLLEQVCKAISKHDMANKDNAVLLMVSGGSDSTALAYIAKELAEEGILGPLAMLHVNHKLRARDAEKDQEFVELLARELDIPLFVCVVDIASEVERTGDNEEAVARRERYIAADEALESLCMHQAVPLADGRIFTAHTQDDRVENFYMRSIVGTGPGGFRSMLYGNGPVVRPLLDIGRQDLRDYLTERVDRGETVVRDEEGALWRDDATNAHTDKFRAYVRHEIVPLAKARNPQLLDTLCRIMNLIADEDDMVRAQAELLEERCVNWMSDTDDRGVDHEFGCVILPGFAGEPVPLQRRVVFAVLQKILGHDARVETASVEAVLAAFDKEEPGNGRTANIQGNLAISANKQGVRVEPMSVYRKRRKNVSEE